MSDVVKKNTVLGIETESTEGTYVAPSATTSYVQTEADGLEMNPSKELLERNIFNSSIGVSAPRVGMSQVQVAIPIEFKANSTTGSAPEADKLYKAAMGNRRQISTTTTTKSSGNTATVLQIEDADISKFTVGDIIRVNQSGAYHVSPITAKSTGTGSATITMLVPHPSGDCTDSVVIDKCTTYIVADSGHPSLSISRYEEDAILDKALGCRVTSMSIENFTTGKIPSVKFAVEGLSHAQSLTAPPYTPSYDTGAPPIMLEGGVYMDGTALAVNEVSVSLENTLGFKTSIAAANGRVSSRPTERRISGSLDPYKASDSIANYTKFTNNTEFSLFIYGKVPTSTAGQFGQIVALYLPKCIITELGESDQDGILKDAITFAASRGTDGSTDEMYLGFI